MEDGAVIFDNDGIVVETESLHFKARVLALSGLGIDLTKADYIAKGISLNHREFLTNVCPLEKLPPSEYDKFFYEIIQKNYANLLSAELTLVPGFLDLLDRIRIHFLIAVASTQPLEMVQRVLGMTLGKKVAHFVAIVSGEQVKRNKPHPDVYLQTAQLLKLAPSRCVAVEDQAVGVTAAKSAGMKCIARVSEWSNPDALKSAGADVLVEDYQEVTMELILQLLE